MLILLLQRFDDTNYFKHNEQNQSNNADTLVDTAGSLESNTGFKCFL